MFHVEVRFRKPVAQIAPLARVSETTIETYLNSFKNLPPKLMKIQKISVYMLHIKEGRKTL
jgi:hypothetical protein